MPLKQASDRGTKADGSLSDSYCHYCYQQGAFTAPDCTLEQMRAICKEAMHKQGLNKLLIWISLKTLPGLKRWKQADTSKP
jgi:hypothetical protein